VLRAGRISVELVTDALRNASPGVPTGSIGDLAGCTTPGPLAVTQGQDGPDSLEVVHAVGGVVTTLRQPYAADSTLLTVVDGSRFAAGDLAVVSDLGTGGHVVRITRVAQSGSEWRLTTSAPSACPAVSFPAEGYSPGALVIRARLSRFSIGDFLGLPTLMVDGDGDGPDEAEPLAEGIEDLQVAVGVDVDGDGRLTDTGDSADEWFGNDPSDSAPPASPRAVRVTLVARATLPENGAPSFRRPAVEDHAAGAQEDNYRRRVLSSTVEIRNLEGSP